MVRLLNLARLEVKLESDWIVIDSKISIKPLVSSNNSSIQCQKKWAVSQVYSLKLMSGLHWTSCRSYASTKSMSRKKKSNERESKSWERSSRNSKQNLKPEKNLSSKIGSSMQELVKSVVFERLRLKKRKLMQKPKRLKKSNNGDSSIQLSVN